MAEWIVTLLALGLMWPWARALLHGERKPGLLWLTTLALSIGLLSLSMLWQGLADLKISWAVSAAILILCSTIGWYTLVRRRSFLHGGTGSPFSFLHQAIRLTIIVVCALIVFNAVYWPFSIDDSVTIYAFFGKQIAHTGYLPVGNLYELYPMLIPLSYAFTHQAAQWTNEYVAALIPALLSIGVVGVAYALARELFGSTQGRLTGLFSALVAALTPAFVQWASAGYVDLPSGFFFGLAAIYALRYGQNHRWQDALTAGIMAGLALWTKNSAFLLLPSLALWLVYVQRRDRPRGWWRAAAACVVGCIAVAGPWYVRNMVMAGMLIPPTGWTWAAQRSVGNLVPYLTNLDYFPTGILLTAGLIVAAWSAWRGKQRSPYAFLLLFTLPFFAVWWLLFSYDDRFLFSIFPFVAVMAGSLLTRLIEPRLPREIHHPNRWRMAIAAVLALLAAYPAFVAVDFKTQLIRNPFPSDAEKHRIVMGDRYDMALFLRTLPTASTIRTTDLLLPYHADGMRVIVGGAVASPADLSAYQYWVAAPGEVLPTWFFEWFSKNNRQPLYQVGGYRLFKLR